MSATISGEFEVYNNGRLSVTQTYTARRVFGLWWSRIGVMRSDVAMHGAARALAEAARDGLAETWEVDDVSA